MAGELLELMHDGDRGALRKVVVSFESTIAGSFKVDGSRMTRAEVVRRFRILEGAYRELRGDLGWGMRRTLDELPRALRCKLDGAPWEPRKQRVMWVPSDGRI